jgi:hypothetical protein
LGVAIGRIKPGGKQPDYQGWTKRSLEPEDFDANDHPCILLGPLSPCGLKEHSMVGIDLDHPKAVRFADHYLPATDMIEGRPGKPKSHRYYLIPNDSIPEEEYSTAAQAATAAIRFAGHPGPRTRQFRGSDGKEILRVLGTGGQLVCPPSLHPNGERRGWNAPGNQPGRPAVIRYTDLRDAVEHLARECGWVPKEDRYSDPSPGAWVAKAVKLNCRLELRVERYLAKCPPAVSGQGGHDQLFKVAVALVHGFAMDPDSALAVLTSHYNPRCRPMWSAVELRHKVEDAARVLKTKPRGYLLDSTTPADPLPTVTPGTIRRDRPTKGEDVR